MFNEGICLGEGDEGGEVGEVRDAGFEIGSWELVPVKMCGCVDVWLGHRLGKIWMDGVFLVFLSMEKEEGVRERWVGFRGWDFCCGFGWGCA